MEARSVNVSQDPFCREAGMSIYQRMLRLGSYLNFAIALAHILLFLGMVFAIDRLNAVTRTVGVHIGPPSGGWFGWTKLLLMIVGVAAFVSILGLYGLSGAGRIRRLPLLRTGLIFTTVIFILNGAPKSLGEIAWLEVLVAGRDPRLLLALIPLWQLAIALLYLVGTVGLWRVLQPTRRGESVQGAGEV